MCVWVIYDYIEQHAYICLIIYNIYIGSGKAGHFFLARPNINMNWPEFFIYVVYFMMW